jgi:DNA topoisomerase-2
MAKFVYPDAKICNIVLGKDTDCPWEVAIAITSNNATSKKNISQISNVNGVNVRAGKHIEHINEQIIDGVKTRVEKTLKNSDIKFQPSFVYNNIFIFANAQIPGVKWTGQRKDEAQCETKKLTQYNLTAPFIKSISDSLEDQIISSLYNKSSVIGISKKSNITVDKYIKARFSGKSNKDKCSLILPEGDSAAGTIIEGMTKIGKNSQAIGFDYYGIMYLRGVIINVRKEVDIKTIDGKKYINCSKKINENEFFEQFLEATGLNVEYKYDPASPTYGKEMKELKYGRIIGACDNDTDGSWIFLLLANMFDLFWPNLLRAGFVCKWETPRYRAYPKTGGTILEFYSDFEYTKWVDEDSTHSKSHYNIDYIKGLAGHDENCMTNMIKNFTSNIYTFYPDDLSNEAFEIFFGNDAGLRKKWLKTPIKVRTPQDELLRLTTKRSNISSYIHYEGKEHAISNLDQKLWSYIDGMNESGRKILDGAIKAFGNSSSKMKLVELQGTIMKDEAYQHGETSLQESIFGKALICVGGVQIPQIVPKSSFGTRRSGGEDHGAARYVSCVLNKRVTKLLYSDTDYCNLEFVYDDGKRVEPKYFCPILPTAILENVCTPAHGWKIETWARDVFQVIDATKYLINNYKILTESANPHLYIPELQPEKFGFKGTFRNIRGKLHSIGDYIYDPVTRVITIKELPLQVWSQNYIASLKKNKATYNGGTAKKPSVTQIFVPGDDNPRDETGERVNIEIKLAPIDPVTKLDPYEIIQAHADGFFLDGFESYFQLHRDMSSCLSMMDPRNSSVIEFINYEEIMRQWFEVRRKYYIIRVEREILLYNIEILRDENIIRYIENYDDLKIQKIKKQKAIEILEANKYDRFQTAILSSRGHIKVPEDRYLKNNELTPFIVNSPDATYSYLLRTSDENKLSEEIEERKAELEKLKAKRDKYVTSMNIGDFPGANIWLDEIEELQKIIKWGQSTRWQYDDSETWAFA